MNPPSVKPSAILELQRLSEDIARMVDQLQSREADARRAAERLSATLESAPSIAIQWFDCEGRILYWNEASTRMYGFSALEAVGYSLAERTLYLRDEEQVQALQAVIADVIESGQPFGPAEFTLRHKDGHELLVLATLFAIPAEDGSRLVACMDVDVTEHRRAEDQIRQLNLELEDRVIERTEALSAANAELAKNLEALRQAQQQLVQAEKLSALGRLVAGVAHELNTPIGNSLMAVSSLREPMEQIRAALAGGGLKRSMLDSFVRHVGEGTDIAQRNLSRAAELVMSFKQVAVDQTTSQRRRFKLDAAIEEILLTLHPMLKRSAHKLSTTIEAGIELDSYPGPLAQVITNLVHNAMLHAFEGREAEGQITIKAQRLESRPALVRLEVGDNGVGISAEAMGRIFDPFYTTRMGRGGTGLGLHIVHNLVTQLMGGEIRVHSRPGQGTVFELLLPLQAPASGAQA